MQQPPTPEPESASAAPLLRQLQAVLENSRHVAFADTGTLAAQIQNLVQDIHDHFEHTCSITALDLVESLLAGHQTILDRSEDVDGLVRDALRRGVDTWLELAAALRLKSPRARDWAGKTRAFFEANSSGIFDQLIANSRGLLNPEELRQLAWRYESEAKQAIKNQAPNEHCAAGVRACLGLRSIGVALSDIALIEKSVTLASSSPTPLQLAEIVQFAVKFDELPRARYWLRQPQWQQDPARKQSLEHALQLKSGEGTEAKAGLLNSLFDDLSSLSLHEYLQVADHQDIEVIRHRVIEIAQQQDDACESIDMLIMLAEVHAAAEILIGSESEISTAPSGSLLKWAQVFEAGAEYLAAILCYRHALQHAIRHHHALDRQPLADYLKKLQALDQLNPDYRQCRDHPNFLQRLQQQAGRLSSS